MLWKLILLCARQNERLKICLYRWKQLKKNSFFIYETGFENFFLILFAEIEMCTNIYRFYRVFGIVEFNKTIIVLLTNFTTSSMLMK